MYVIRQSPHTAVALFTINRTLTTVFYFRLLIRFRGVGYIFCLRCQLFRLASHLPKACEFDFY